MKTFVIPDLHGRYDLLHDALSKIETEFDNGTVVFLGDYIDRGPQSKQIIDKLMSGPSTGWTWHCIRGNHEDMAITCHDKNHPEYQWWFGHGGKETLQSYDGDIPEDHISWMNSLPRLYWDKYRVYTHAAVSEGYKLEEQPEVFTQWTLYPDRANIGYYDRHVVHGHHDIGPELYDNRTNLDAKAYASGMLYVGVFDDDVPGGPVDLWKVKNH